MLNFRATTLNKTISKYKRCKKYQRSPAQQISNKPYLEIASFSVQSLDVKKMLKCKFFSHCASHYSHNLQCVQAQNSLGSSETRDKNEVKRAAEKFPARLAAVCPSALLAVVYRIQSVWFIRKSIFYMLYEINRIIDSSIFNDLSQK